MLDVLLSPVQITSHDASKTFIEKVGANDKTFSSYAVSDYSVVLHIPT